MLRKLFLLLTLLLSAAAQAAEFPYTTQRFNTLQQQGKPILVFIHADWCPTCKKQEIILGDLFRQHVDEFAPLTLLKVDFDTQQGVVNGFGVKYQSTLIVFRDGSEKGRVTASTDRKEIATLLRRVL
jgi:thioredoxin 1